MDFTPWVRHFERNGQLQRALEAQIDGAERCRLDTRRRRAFVRSFQRFELGESGDGRHLLAKAERAGDAQYTRALALLVAEEQRHSALFARGLDHLGGTPLAGTGRTPRSPRCAGRSACAPSSGCSWWPRRWPWSTSPRWPPGRPTRCCGPSAAGWSTTSATTCGSRSIGWPRAGPAVRWWCARRCGWRCSPWGSARRSCWSPTTGRRCAPAGGARSATPGGRCGACSTCSAWPSDRTRRRRAAPCSRTAQHTRPGGRSAVAVDPGRGEEHRGAAFLAHHPVEGVPVVVGAAGPGEHRAQQQS